MSACSDDCHSEIPVARPTVIGSPQVRASILSWVFVIAGLVAGTTAAPPWMATGLFAASILAGGFYFAREAVEELLEKRVVGIELLMSLAIVAAAALGRWREAALVAALYSITEALEGFTIQRTRFAIRGLMDMVPPRARVIRDGREHEVGIEEVQVGDQIVVRPGESIPTDGSIREGASTINESAVTGESMPVERGPGAAVYAGTLNGNGSLLVEATRTHTDNTVARIIELVERAQQQKGRSQLLVERFARWYSPAVLGGSVLAAVVPIALGGDAVVWLTRAASLLVAAAPCALAVATPVTLVAGIGAAARRGVLIKGGNILEQLGKVKAVALDKTGTLTAGKPEVTRLLALRGDENTLLQTAASVEHLSEHPVAAAIVRAAGERKLERRRVTDFQALTAAGVQAKVDGRPVAVLKPEAVASRGLTLPAAASSFAEEASGRGETVVAVLEDGAVAGLIAIADTLRHEARELVARLHAAGVEHVVMLTGDNEGTARAIAAQAGIDEYYAALLPEDKVERVRRLREKYGGVAMVGDGINDAPALAAASVGIAMGTGGSDAAIAAADVALVSDDLSRLGYAITLGRASARTITQNLIVAMAIVAALVVGTLVADFTMLTAVLGHEGSEVLIVANGLRVALHGRGS